MRQTPACAVRAATLLRVEPGCFLIIAQRVVEIAGAFAGLRAQHVIAGGRIEPDRAVEIGDGAGVVVLAQIDLAATAVRR